MKDSMPVAKICISLQQESMTQLAYLMSRLNNPSLSRSGVIAACIADVYERVLILENKK